jgi:type V secretory pathway adhesin AidA
MRLSPDRSSVSARIVYIHLDALCRSNPEMGKGTEVEAKLTSVNGHAGYMYRNTSRGFCAWTYQPASEANLRVIMGDRNQVRYDDHLRPQPTERCVIRNVPLNDPSSTAKLLARYLSTGNY